MDLLVRWQFTKDNPTEYKTQVDIIKCNLTPLIEDKSFQNIILSFYITRQERTDVRLAVFVEEDNLEALRNIVKKYTSSLEISAGDNDWNGSSVNDPFLPDCEGSFYKEYLEDISFIGIGFHKGNLELLSVDKIMQLANSREELNALFQKLSKGYKEKNPEELNKFWGICGWDFKSTTPGSEMDGPHFFYNLALGCDPR
jgi:hypothetical protein